MHLFVGRDDWSANLPYQVSGYKVADKELTSTQSIRVWWPLSYGHDAASLILPLPGGSEPGNVIFEGKGWVGDRERCIAARNGDAGYWLDIEDSGAFGISADGQCVVQLELDPAADQASIESAVVGPLIMLALAIQGNWCLHASAVTVAGHTVAFLGESGAGKSTLAGWLTREGGEHALRVADDILPVTAGENGRVTALPHFPQLKLPADAQPALSLPQRMSLDAVYVLSRPAAGEQVAIQPLDGQEAALKLVRHTAASRLFAPDLLVKHLDFCLNAAASVPVRRLSYPLTVAALPAVREAMTDDLGLA